MHISSGVHLNIPVYRCTPNYDNKLCAKQVHVRCNVPVHVVSRDSNLQKCSLKKAIKWDY